MNNKHFIEYNFKLKESLAEVHNIWKLIRFLGDKTIEKNRFIPS